MLIKHEYFNIYGKKNEVESLREMIAENELCIKKIVEKDNFKQGIGDHKYMDCGKYNGKELQLILSYAKKEIYIMWDGELIGDCYNSKSKNAWVVNIYTGCESGSMQQYTGNKGVKGGEVLKYAIMNDLRTMHETYTDAFQYYQIQKENIHHEYLGKHITLKFTEGNEGMYEMFVKDGYGADVFYDFETKKYSVHDGVDGYGWHDTLYKAVEHYIDCEYRKNHEEYYVPKCRKCGDGGCWHCEPYRFL